MIRVSEFFCKSVRAPTSSKISTNHITIFNNILQCKILFKIQNTCWLRKGSRPIFLLGPKYFSEILAFDMHEYMVCTRFLFPELTLVEESSLLSTIIFYALIFFKMHFLRGKAMTIIINEFSTEKSYLNYIISLSAITFFHVSFYTWFS